MTRKFRADLSLGAEVLDAVDEAIAVFDGSGRVVTTNRRYAAQWGDDAGATLADHMARWRREFMAAPREEASRRDVVEARRAPVSDEAPAVEEAPARVESPAHAAGSTAAAYNLVLGDVFPPGVNYVAGSVTTSAGTVTDTGGQIAKFNKRFGSFGLNVNIGLRGAFDIGFE